MSKEMKIWPCSLVAKTLSWEKHPTWYLKYAFVFPRYPVLVHCLFVFSASHSGIFGYGCYEFLSPLTNTYVRLAPELPKYMYSFSGEWLISISEVLYVSHTLAGSSLGDTSSFALYHVPDMPTADAGQCSQGIANGFFMHIDPTESPGTPAPQDKIACSRRFPAVHQSNK